MTDGYLGQTPPLGQFGIQFAQSQAQGVHRRLIIARGGHDDPAHDVGVLTDYSQGVREFGAVHRCVRIASLHAARLAGGRWT